MAQLLHSLGKLGFCAVLDYVFLCFLFLFPSRNFPLFKMRKLITTKELDWIKQVVLVYLSFCDPLSYAHGPVIKPNGRAMVFMLKPFKTIPLSLDTSKTLCIEGVSPHYSRREHGGHNVILGYVDFVDVTCSYTSLSASQGVFSQ
uniref:Uncharacterized protein n=1 Tax=Solanum lycopersicum TaxID=4081 RepID=A0A3Q7IE36_SOLLC